MPWIGRPAWRLVVLAPAFFFFLTACSKHPSASGGIGTGESFGGGDPLLGLVNGVRHRVATGTALLANHPEVATSLCDPAMISEQNSDFFSVYLTPDNSQIKACRELLDRLLNSDIITDETDSPFALQSQPIAVVLSGVSMDVMASSPIGKKGTIHFFDQRVQTASPFQLGMIVVHEFLHQLAGSPLDEDRVAGYLMNFLDYSGAALYAAVLKLTTPPASPSPVPSPSSTPNPAQDFRSAKITFAEGRSLFTAEDAQSFIPSGEYLNQLGNPLEGPTARIVANRECQKLGYAGGTREDASSDTNSLWLKCIPSDQAIQVTPNTALGGGCEGSTWTPPMQANCDMQAFQYCTQLPDKFQGGILLQYSPAQGETVILCFRKASLVTTSVSTVLSSTGIPSFNGNFSQVGGALVNDTAASVTCQQRGYHGGTEVLAGGGSVTFQCF